MFFVFHSLVKGSIPAIQMALTSAVDALANSGNSLFVDEDYDGALQQYSSAIEQASDSSELYVLRAAVHLKLENFTSAISDCNKAIVLDPMNAKAFLRKGVACFQMEEFATAKTAFEKGRELDPDTAQFKTWIRKCNAEIEEEMVVGETSSVFPELTVGESGTGSAETIELAKPIEIPPPSKPIQRFRHDFIQNPTHVTVTVYIKGATKDNCIVEYEERSVSLDWSISKGDSWQLAFHPLFDYVDAVDCTTSFYGTKVEIKLKKRSPGKWESLEFKEDEKALDELTDEVCLF
jgi:suppressor of G2 allele of SKP1